MENEKKYCKSCFATVQDDAKFCTACGAPIEEEPKEEAKEEEAPKYTDADIERILAQKEAELQAKQEPKYDYYQSDAPQPKPEVSKKNSIISMIFGLVALEFAVTSIIPIYAIVFMVVGIVFSVLAKRKSTQYIEEAGAPNAFTKVGRITATIALPVSIVFGVIGLILTIALFLE